MSPAKKRGAPREEPAPPAPLVLIVDDFLDTREMYSDFLEFAGLRTDTAETAEEGLAKAFTEKPSIIIMDLALPGSIDGWEATRRLKADGRTKDVPVIVVTGHAMPDQLKAASDAGADAVCAKPLLPTELLEKIMPFLQKPSDSTPPPDALTATRKRRRYG